MCHEKHAEDNENNPVQTYPKKDVSYHLGNNADYNVQFEQIKKPQHSCAAGVTRIKFHTSNTPCDLQGTVHSAR
jgi:hypothetical protein